MTNLPKDPKKVHKSKDEAITLQKDDNFEQKSSSLSSKLLEKLNHDDIKEVYQTFIDLDDEASKEIVAQSIKKIKTPPIEIARIGHRIWTYFYEKTILRIALLLWFFQSNLLKKILPFEIPILFNLDLEQMPSFFRKILLSEPGAESPTHIVAGGLFFFVGFIVIWITWKFWLAYLESKWNKNYSGSTLLRRNLGIIVVDKQGEPIGIIKTFLRGFFRMPIVSMLIIISMEYSAYERGLHDKLFGTYVLRINQDVDPQQIALFITNNYK